MKNRNAYIRVLFALLLFASCGETTEPVEEFLENAIGFTPATLPDDPFRSTGDLSTATLDAMTVFAHYTGTDDFNASSTPNFMYNQLVTKGAGNVWAYSPVKYWPLQNQKVSFFAVAPAPSADNGIEIVNGNAYTGYPAFRITPPVSPAAQADFCMATPVLNATYANPNGNESNDTDGQVKFHFEHAMAKLTFSAKYSSNEDFGIVVGKIEIKGLYGSNILRFTETGFAWDALDAASPTDDYVLSLADKTLVDIPLNQTGFTKVSADGTGELMLIPQTIPADVKIKVSLWVGGKWFDREGSMQLPISLQAGKSYNYSLTISDNNMSNVLSETVWEYAYTGNAQTFVAPQDGIYKLEAWGAGGESHYAGRPYGYGGYVKGLVSLKSGQSLGVYVGQYGNRASGVRKNWNGGGYNDGGENNAGYGGGATDFRLLLADVDPAVWNTAASLNSRILVAGAGGGSGDNAATGTLYHGHAGGLQGYDNYPSHSEGGTQTEGGFSAGNDDGSFGLGGNSTQNYGGSGGGGYYGGAGGRYANGHGSGGSSFISGMPNCVAIDPADITNDPRDRDEGNIPTALNYKQSVFGRSATWVDGDEIIISEYSMIDGAGYEWNSGQKSDTPIGMPDWNNAVNTVMGNTGQGHARVTRVMGP
jgi:hypothetical protein